MSTDINRRKFLGSTAGVATAFAIVPRHVLGGPGYQAPSDKLTLAHVGFGTQAIREVGGLLNDPNFQLTAVCDVEKDGVNYLEWTKNEVRTSIRRLIQEPTWREGKEWTPGGRDVGKELIETFYKKQGQNNRVNTYADFREMFEKEKDLDVVKVMTPDHMHMFVSLAAMKKGKHVMVHKPLANRVLEGRLIVETAQKLSVKTHYLPASESPAVRMVADWINEGAIGTLREIHNWSCRPLWPHYTKLPADRPPIPKDFNWQLWLGPVPDRPYHPWYTHTTFRGWYDFGGGCLADMGIYSLWPIFRTYDLDAPYWVETRPGTVCEVVDGNVCTKIQNDYAYPLSSIARMRFAAKGARPALDIFWYDGGMKPPTPDEYGNELPTEGMIYVGDKGKILAGFRSDSPRIIPESKMDEFRKGRNIQAPGPLSDSMASVMGTAEQVAAARRRAAEAQAKPAPKENQARQGQRARQGQGARQNPLVAAIRTGNRSFADFSYAAPITDAQNLVAISLRLGGQKLLWDAAAVKITNMSEANKYLTREYRKGWEPGLLA